MKNFSFLFLILATLSVSNAQAPHKMSFQAVVRNDANALISNSSVGIRISLLQGTETGTAVYVETHTPTSNDNGLVTFEIGGGTSVSGIISSIDWSSGPYFIKTETDPTGGSNYSISGTTQLMSVPYALYAGNSSSIDAGTEPGQMLYWTGSSWEEVVIGAKGQVLTFCDGKPTWTWAGVCRDAIIGDPGPAGGIVFYDKGFYSDGWRYLESGPVDITTNAPFGCRETTIGATLREIGAGDSNTIIIVNACAEPGIAARYCYEYSLNGFDDWYLPSRDELYLMWINLHQQGFGNFVNDDYWASTEFVATQAWSLDFFHGDHHNLDKEVPKHVRPIRKF